MLLTFFLGCSVRSCTQTNKEYDNNLIALVDSVEYYKGKNNELIAQKTLLEGDVDVLKTANEELYEKVRSMGVKKPDQVVYIETVVEHEKHDTTFIRETVDSIYNFDFSNKWRELTGNIKVDSSDVSLNIDKDVTYFDASVVIKDNKAYVTSNNPYLKVTNMSGYSIPEKKDKKWGIGPYAGIEYDFAKREWGVSLGISISYHLFDW